MQVRDGYVGDITFEHLTLTPSQRDYLRDAGLSPETVKDAGIEAVCPSMIPKIVGSKKSKNITSLMAIEYPDCDGFTRYKLFPPDEDNGKYHQLKGTGVRLYSPPEFNPDAQMIRITEGEIKALKATQAGLNCLALAGIWAFQKRDVRGNPQLIDDFNRINWEGKDVEIIPDSGFQTNVKVKQAVYRLARLLETEGAKVKIICLPQEKTNESERNKN